MHHSDVHSCKMSSDIENMDWSTGTANAPLPSMRFGSGSSQTSQNSGDICRICHCESDAQNPLLTPCYCSGSLKYVHQTCLQQWLTASETNACELCKFPFIMHTKIKPFNEWRSLDMSGVERRRLFCAVLFHCAAALCVIWSLCVLIERAAEEVKRGLIGWPFWTKLVVVTVGLTGGVVFMYIQCRQYLHLCHRWRARNRILLIQNAPEKQPIAPPSPVLNIRLADFPRRNNSSSGNVAAGNSYNNVNNGNRLPQAQIIANIESNPANYERDWMLDDSSQSSFKPYQQGSGSLTPLPPFHDSAQTMYETYQMRSSGHSSSNGSGRDLSQNPHVIYASSFASVGPTSSTATVRNHDTNILKTNLSHNRQYPNTSIFLENSDILDDKEYPKLYHRHSTVIDERKERDLNRRFSDTKLLQAANSDEDSFECEENAANATKAQTQPIFNVATVLGTAVPPMTAADRHNAIDAQVTDIIFDNNSMREAVDGDATTNVRNASIYPRHSLHNVLYDPIAAETQPTKSVTENRYVFKSMPNLSASSENLLQKQ